MPNISEFQLGIDGKAYIEKDDGTNTVVDLTESTSNLRDKIRNSIASAKQNNPLENTPWFKCPAWAASTVYYQGQEVIGPDGVSSYICQTSGTSASSGGPTGQGFASITDGTVIWWYRGLARGLSAHNSSVVTFGNSTTLAGNIANYRTISDLDQTVIQAGGGTVFYDSVNTMTNVRASNNGTSSSPTYTGSIGGAYISFITDSSKIVLKSVNAIFAGQYGIVVEINDRLVFDSVTVPTSTINPGGYYIDMSSFIQSGTFRKVTIRCLSGFNTVCKQILLEPSSTIFKPQNTNSYKIAVEGDSLSAGGNFTPYRCSMDWLTQVAQRIGCENSCNMAQGGTGFISDNAGVKTTYLQRLPELVALNADVYIIAGNHNDASYSNSAQQDAALAYFKALRLAQPKALVIVFGNNILRGEGNTGTILTAEQNLKAAFDTWKDTNSIFVPVLTSSAGGWVTGTGSTNSPNNSGNQERFYNTADSHPIQRGVDYFAQRYFHALNSVFA